MRELELRLIGHEYPDGELGARKAGKLSEAVDELVYRLTRNAAGAEALGRTRRHYERLAEVRLVAIEPGSAKLIFHIGQQDVLDTDPVAELTHSRLLEVVDGLTVNQRPASASDPVSSAVDGLVRALQGAAPEVTLRVDDHVTSPLRTSDLDRDVWRTRPDGTVDVTLAGRLEMVDLYSSRFRILDDVGNRIELHDVQEADDAAQLVGSRVTAQGTYFAASGSGRPHLEDAVIRKFVLVEALELALSPQPQRLQPASEALTTMPDELALSEDELAEFLALIDE